MHIPRSLYQRRGTPGGGGQPGNRLTSINPSMMARLQRNRGARPAGGPPPQAYGGPPAPQVPFQGGEIGSGQDPSAGMPDFAQMGDAIKKIYGQTQMPGVADQVAAAGLPAVMPSGPAPQNTPMQGFAPSPPGMAGGGQMAGMDPEMMAGIMKILPMLAMA